MKNLWKDLDIRVYTSNLLGRSDELVLHGGGNTSVKIRVDNEDILYVKGSGWDLVSIKAEGFSPVRVQSLLDMAKLDYLSDSDMVKLQRDAMIDKSAPNPSVEAILHALIPYKVVDHTHADAIVTISNSINGKNHIKELFPNFLIVDYIMPGFLLAKKIYEMTKDFDWDRCEGIILHNHGIFTFDDDAKKSYSKMIESVTQAEEFLDKNSSLYIPSLSPKDFDIDKLSTLISKAKGYEVVTKINTSPISIFYSLQENLKSFATRGVLTPEHIIRTKREPLILENNRDMEEALIEYMDNYQDYFDKFSTDEIILNKAPNYAVISGVGFVSFGKNQKEVDIIDDIISHTIKAILKADKLGGYESISIKDSFDMEYWELEQNKLKATK